MEKAKVKSINNELSYSISRLKYLLSDGYDNFKNRLDYEKIEREIQHQR